MPVEIPLRSDQPRWTQQVVVGDEYDDDDVSFTDGVSYTLIFDWNGRASVWTMGIQDADGVDLLRGKALRLGSLRTKRHGRESGLPPGDFLLVDLTGTHTEAGLTSLGSTHSLLYYTAGGLEDAGL